MGTLRQLQNGLERAWDQLAEGWAHLRQRASEALTRFSRPARGELQPAEERWLRQAPSWGLLAAEVEEDDDQVVVRLEAPGMDPDDFDIQVVDDVLVVRGEKRFQSTSRQGAFRVMECAYGAFERAVPLPAPVDEGRAKARYRRGVLQVTLPKHATARRRRIDIRAE